MSVKCRKLIHVLIGIVSFAVLPQLQAVTPAPDGGYPNGNTVEGTNALFSLTTGGYNTAAGYFALRSATTGSFNTAIGAGALFANTNNQNTAIGFAALLSNTTGDNNTAIGATALFHNTTGNVNTATGEAALQSNTTGTHKAFLAEQRKVQELEKGMATLAATLKEQAAEIQKVGRQVEISKSTVETAANNR